MRLKAFIMSIVMICTSVTITGNVSADDLFVTSSKESTKGNVTYPIGVTSAMTNASYWADKASSDPDAVLLDMNQIDEFNRLALETPSTNMNDLINISGEYNASSLKKSLASAAIPTKKLYIKGKLIDNTDYFEPIFCP